MTYKSLRHLAALSIAVFGLFSIGTVHAQSDTFDVTATVEDACVITADDYDFGVYNPVLGNVLPQELATVEITCNLLTLYEVGLDDGQNASGGARNMVNENSSITTNNLLTYTMGCVLPDLSGLLGTIPAIVNTGLFDAAGCLSDWRSASGSTFVGIGLGDIPLLLPLAGSISGGQDVAVGTYRDTLTATVTY